MVDEPKDRQNEGLSTGISHLSTNQENRFGDMCKSFGVNRMIEDSYTHKKHPQIERREYEENSQKIYLFCLVDTTPCM